MAGDHDALLDVQACPLCASPRATAFSIGSVPLRRCDDCELVYAAEMLDPEALYVDGYTLGGHRPDAPLMRAIAAHAAVRRFELIEATMPIGSVLDVGCGVGEALAVAVERGWRGVGVEPVPELAERARSRGLDVRTGTLTEAGVERRSFDLVCAWHVVEHMAAPVEFVRELATFVREGGTLALEVPNWLHPARGERGEAWDQLCPGEHLAHYTPDTMSELLRRSGLEPCVRTITTIAETPEEDRAGLGFAVFATARVGLGDC